MRPREESAHNNHTDNNRGEEDEEEEEYCACLPAYVGLTKLKAVDRERAGRKRLL